MSYDPSTTTGAASTPDDGGSGRAQQVAASAKEQGRHTAEVASGELKSVAGEAKTQARDLVGELRTQVGQQTSTQKQRLVDAVKAVADELQQMSSTGSGPTAALAGQAATRVQSLHGTLESSEPSDLLNQGRAFARQRPGQFLLGSLVAGVLAGRITRGSRAAVSSPSGGASNSPALQSSDIGTARSAGTYPSTTQYSSESTTGYGEQTFEPSTYDAGYESTTTSTMPGSTPGSTTGYADTPYSDGGGRA